MGSLTDITAVRTALAAAAGTITGPPALRVQHWPVVGTISTPAFAVHDMITDFDLAMGRGADDWLFECRLYAANLGDGRTASDLLDRFLAPKSAMSIKTAIEVDRTLGGNCSALRVERIHGYAVYTVGADSYLGARFDVRVY